MKSEMFPACPVCEEQMASDANAASYCKLLASVYLLARTCIHVNGCTLCGMSMTAIGKRFCVSCEQKFRLMMAG